MTRCDIVYASLLMCIDLYIYSCSCTYHVLYICYFCMFELYSVQDPAFVTAPSRVGNPG